MLHNIGYRHPQQIVAAFIIPIKANPDLASAIQLEDANILLTTVSG